MGGLFALVRGHREARATRTRSRAPGSPYGILGFVDRPGDVLVAHRGEGSQPRARRPIVVELHPHRQGTRAARRAARGRRRRGRPAVRPGRRSSLAEVTGNATLGRRRLDRHRRAAGRHRDRPRGRDEGPADRGGRPSDENLDAISRRHRRPPTRCSGIIHLRTMHLGPDELLVAAKLDFDHVADVSTIWPTRHRRGRGRPACRRADRHNRVHRARHLPQPRQWAMKPIARRRRSRPRRDDRKVVPLAMALVAVIVCFSDRLDTRQAGATPRRDDRLLANGAVHRSSGGASCWVSEHRLADARRPQGVARPGHRVRPQHHGRSSPAVDQDHASPSCRVHRRTHAVPRRAAGARLVLRATAPSAPLRSAVISLVGLALVLFFAPTTGEFRGWRSWIGDALCMWPTYSAGPVDLRQGRRGGGDVATSHRSRRRSSTLPARCHRVPSAKLGRVHVRGRWCSS